MITAFDLAQRYVGVIKELAGVEDHPFIQWCLMLCDFGPNAKDETPWCSAFLNHICWELRLPRSKSAAARSWLSVGIPIPLEHGSADYCVVILKRGSGIQPGPEVLKAPGHVGFFAGIEGKNVLLLAGNQGNTVSVAPFPSSRILGIRRLA